MDVFVVLLLSGFCVPTASFPNIYYFVNENMTQQEADAYCIKEHTGLAQITYPENNTAVINTPAGGYTGKAWIGLFMVYTNWTWVKGGPAFYFRWSANQSDSVGGEEFCASMDYTGEWYNNTCTETKFSVCFNGSEYIVDTNQSTWNDAQINCERKHSSLVQIYDNQTNDHVSTLLTPEDKQVWIGLAMFPFWIWSETNKSSTFTNWETAQPDNQNGNENCAAIVVKNGTWTNEPCSAQYPFFCSGVYKTKKTVLSMNIQTDADLGNPDNSAALMQQFQASLAKQGVTDFKLTWTKQPVKQSKTTTKDLCSP